MDELHSPNAGGSHLTLALAGEAWSWRLTLADGERVTGLAPDRIAAGRSAAFAAASIAALRRIGRRRF